MKEKITLEQRLEQLDDDQIVYLGGKKGTAFCFIGTVKDLKEELKDINRRNKDRLINYMRASFQTIKNAEANIAIENENRDKLIKELADRSTKLSDAELKDKITDLKTTKSNIERLNKNMAHAEKVIKGEIKTLKEWVPIQKRSVEEEYPRTAEKPGTIILVSGYLFGPYWLYSEAEADRANGYKKQLEDEK